jgi:signal transduction histidine kinase
MLKYFISRNKPATDSTTQYGLREEPANERPLFIIAGCVLVLSLFEFAAVSLSQFFGMDELFREMALFVAISCLLAVAVYHFLVFIYDREGSVYPVFIAEIIITCVYLFTLTESRYGLLIPREVMPESVLKIIAIAAYIIAAVLVAVFSIMLIKKRSIDNISKFYIAILIISVILNIIFILPIPAIDVLFMPEAFPATLVILSQCLMVEAYDEHYLANRYFAVFKREQELAAENRALQLANDKRRDMMNTLSHETRTPLAVLSNYAGLIAAEMLAEGVNEQRARDLDNITEQIQNIAEIMKQYTDLAENPENADLEPISFTEVMNRTSQVYRHILENAGITLKLNLADDLPPVCIAPGRLTQVILNLMKNTARHSKATEMTFTAVSSEKFVTVTASDNGIGLPPEILPKIFERGITASGNSGSTQGAGIGLSVCKEIIEESGGEIFAVSNNGVRITFTLPIYGDNDEK